MTHENAKQDIKQDPIDDKPSVKLIATDLKKYNLDYYSGQNLAEKSLHFLYAVLKEHPNTKIIAYQDLKGESCMLVEEPNECESLLYVQMIMCMLQV